MSPSPMNTKKLQLNRHAKSLLLRHTKNHLFDAEHQAREFFRFLLISKSFLYSSQQYKVYKLHINFYRHTDQIFIVCLANLNGSKYSSTKYLQLTQNELLQLNTVLNFQYVGVKFDGKTFELMEEACRELWREFKGKFALRLEEVSDSQALPLINQLGWRIFQLDRDAKVLADSDQTPNMNLDFCLVKRLENFDQMKSIMKRHRIKRLDIYCNHESFDTSLPQNFFNSFPFCQKLQRLTIYYYIKDGDDFLMKLARMLRFWTNLKKVNIVLKNLRDNRKMAKPFVDNILKMCEDMYELQRTIDNNVKLKIGGCFHEVVIEPYRTTKKSMDRLEQHECFEEAYPKEYNNYGDLCYYIQPNWQRENLRFNIYVEIQLPGQGYRSF